MKYNIKEEYRLFIEEKKSLLQAVKESCEELNTEFVCLTDRRKLLSFVLRLHRLQRNYEAFNADLWIDATMSRKPVFVDPLKADMEYLLFRATQYIGDLKAKITRKKERAEKAKAKKKGGRK